MAMTLHALGPRATLIAAICLFSIEAFAQNTNDTDDDILDGMIDAIAEQLAEDDMMDECARRACRARELSSTPLDINTATEDDLSRLIFLDERKAKAIIGHRRRAGGILTQQELMTVRGLTPMDINMLRRIARIGESRDTAALKRTLKINAIARIGRRYPLSRGFSKTDTTETAYAGNPISQLLRAKVEMGGRLSLGLVADNDAGEPQMRDEPD